MSLRCSSNMEIDICSLTNNIKAEAKRLGFFACGIAHAEPVDKTAANSFTSWIDNGCHAGMTYMTNYSDKRLNPCVLMPEAKSIICVAMNYTPKQRLPEEEYQIASYAYGLDYHDIIKRKLQALADYIEKTVNQSCSFKICCDTVPILERYWAAKAGLGWIGRNHQLIIPDSGNQYFLGELLTSLPLSYDQAMQGDCGNCKACLKACPTGALSQCDNLFHAERCLSYHTIESRDEIPQQLENKLDNYIYGCERCLLACPHNKHCQPTDETLLQPKDELMAMKKEDWHNLSVDKYRQLFKGSAVKRAKYEGLMRNIRAARKNNNNSPME